jgi:hypothetical protein
MSGGSARQARLVSGGRKGAARRIALPRQKWVGLSGLGLGELVPPVGDDGICCVGEGDIGDVGAIDGMVEDGMVDGAMDGVVMPVIRPGSGVWPAGTAAKPSVFLAPSV